MVGMLFSRRSLLRGAASGFIGAAGATQLDAQQKDRPNILFAISDDQSWLHTSSAGDRVVKTPNIDRVAETGVRFTNAFSGAPGCAPSRAAILTGRSIWQLEEAGTHASLFPRKWAVYPDVLEKAGYFAGLTGKGAGPCNYKDAGWTRNPAGPAFDERKLRNQPKGVSNNDYAGNFEDFLRAKPKDRPFVFWYGCHEPHRTYLEGSGRASGKKLDDVVVPPFLPDTAEVRSDLLDYYQEIEHFDRHLGRMLDLLQKRGELENTLIVATADNGMSFPRAKANMYEYGIHLPLSICWPGRLRGGRVVDDLVSFIDFMPTMLESAGVSIPASVTGRSLLPLLTSNRSGIVEPGRGAVFSGRERHSHARFDNLGYPSRVIRTPDFLYIRNFRPELWPAGDPELYADIDGGPTKTYMLQHRDSPLFNLACGKRPAEELFDIRKDPGCLKNLAGDVRHEATRKKLRETLDRTLTEQKDPRMLGNGDIFDSYPRYSPMRPELGGFSTQGAYNPKYQRK